MLRTLIQICALMIVAAASLRAVDPGIAITVTSNGQPVSQGQTVSGVVNITVTVTNGIDMHVATYGNMIFLPFNEPGHRADAPVWSHTTQVDTRRFYDGENLLSVHVHPHNHAGEAYIANFIFGTFKLVSANSNPAPNGDRLLPTLTVSSGFTDWTPRLIGGEYYLSGDASVVDDKTSSGVGRDRLTAAPVQIIAHLGESVLGRFRWNTLTPPFGDQSLVSDCHLRPFQHDIEFDAKVVFFFTDGAGRANYATRTFRMPALPPSPAVDLPQPLLDAKILGLGDGGTLRVPDGGTAPLYIQVSNLVPGAWTYPEMTTWIGNRAVTVTDLLPYVRSLPDGATSVIVEVPIPADEVQRLQAARQGGEMSTATPIWLDFNKSNIPCLPASSHIHLNSVRTTSYPWPYGQATVVIRKPWNNSGHWTGTTLAARYDQWGPLPAGYRVRWKLNGGAWQVDDGDGVISLSGLTRQSHLLEVELTDAALARLPGSDSYAAANFTVTNAAPVAVANSYSVVVNTTLNVTGSGVLTNDQDADGDIITASLTSQPRHGTVSLASTGSFTYVPAPDFVGFDRFSYRATDGALSSHESDVRIQVTAATSGARVFGDWPMLGRDAEHAGYVGGFLGSTAPTLSWTASFPPGNYTVNRIRGSAVVGGKVVTSIDYYAYGQIRVACFNAMSGLREWETFFNSGDVSAPAIANGLAYVQRANHSSDSQMIALDLTSGAVRWSTPYADQWGADWAPTVADGSLWVSGGYYGGLYGYDAITGAQRFFQTLPQFDHWTPAYRGGELFTWLQGTVRRHDALTGVVELSKVLKPTNVGNGWVESMPVLVEDRLVLRDEQRLIVVDPTNFFVHWQRMSSTGNWAQTPVVHDGIVYAITLSQNSAQASLEALDLSNGRRLGAVSLPDTSFTQPIVTDDTIIVSCRTSSYPYSGQTLVIDRATLAVRYTLPHGGLLALADNALYITDGDSNGASPSVRRYAFPVAPPVNRPPVALANAFSIPEDTALTISTTALLANDSDADGNPLSVQVVSQPANGTLTSIAGGYRYAPPIDWYGTTTFTYVANDGQANSQPATVTITVTAVEDVRPYYPGLMAEFFDYAAALSVIPDLTGRTAQVTRIDAQVAYASMSATAWNALPTTMIDTFVSRHSGFIKVGTAGAYTLSVSSDDGSRVYLGGALLIDNDGLHGMRERSATVTLAAGHHPLRVEFFENTGGAGLQLWWSGPGIAKQIVPASALWHLSAPATGLPAPWVSADIGTVGLAGLGTGDGDDFIVHGSGADIWNQADAFQFVHRPLIGDGELVARVASLDNTNSWAKAGVMVRASLSPGSVNGLMVITPTNGAAFQHRATTGGTSASTKVSGRTAPYWVKIKRSGTSVSGWMSADGIAWTQVGATVVLPLGATPLVGLAVTSHDNTKRAAAVFDQVVWIPASGG